MVLLMAGYPMSFDDAKTWAMRNWPDVPIDHNTNAINFAVKFTRYHRQKNRLHCCGVVINGDLCASFLYIPGTCLLVTRQSTKMSMHVRARRCSSSTKETKSSQRKHSGRVMNQVTGLRSSPKKRDAADQDDD